MLSFPNVSNNKIETDAVSGWHPFPKTDDKRFAKSIE